MKKENRPNTITTYNNNTELDQDLRPNQPKIKQVRPQEQAAAIEKTRRTGETRKSYPVKGVNDPE